jgi:hypothetical protein
MKKEEISISWSLQYATPEIELFINVLSICNV